MNIRVVKYSFVILVVILAANLGRLALRPSRVARAAAGSSVPYTAVLKETVIGKDGKVGGVYYHTYARRSDGSFLFKSSGPIGQLNENTLRLIDLASNLHIEVRDLWDVKSTRTGSKPPRLRDPNLSCVYSELQESVLGEEQITGYSAVKITRGEQTSWYALDYGCAVVKDRMAWKEGGVTEKTLLSLTGGEPEKALFYVSESYKEVPPSQIVSRPSGLTAAMVHSNAEEMERQKEVVKRLDRYYYDHRPHSSDLNTR